MKRNTFSRRALAFLLVAALAVMLPVAAMAAGNGVASVGDNDSYESVQEAVDAIAATEGKTGKVRVTADSAENISIPAGVTITLDIADGVTLSGGTARDDAGKSHTITNNGTLTVTGAGTVQNSNGGSGALFNNLGATANLNGATFTGTTWYVLKNLGTMTINGAALTQEDAGSSAIDNGWYGNAGNDCNVSYPGGSVTAKLTIVNGTFSGGMNTVKNDDYGELEIQNGTFSNTDGPTVLNWNVATISGGSFAVNNSSKSVIANGYLNDSADKGQLTITGGSFTASNDGQGALFGYGESSSSGGSFTITGGTFKGSPEISSDYPYTPAISGGEYSVAPTDFVVDGSAMVGLRAASDESAAFHVGTPSEIETLVAGVASGSVEVLLGDLTLAVNDGVTVTNTGDGDVTVNGDPLGTGDEVLVHVHDATAVAANDATCTKEGNIAYWHCEGCGKYFSDEALTVEISEADTVVEALGHDWSEWQANGEIDCTHGYTEIRVCARCEEVETRAVAPAEHNFVDGKCTVCGAADPAYGQQTEDPSSSNETDPNAPSKDDVPVTGDEANVALWALLTVFAAVALCGTLVWRKRLAK